MHIATCQRWNNRRDSYRPAGETIATADYEVAAIASDNVAKRFVAQHHYSGSYVAARFRFGLYRAGQLQGVAVFSNPQRAAVITGCLPGAAIESCELGRFVLLDRVAANGETWFLGRCFKALRAAGLLGVVSFSDPMARTDAAGHQVFGGHLGTIYQAHNATYIGQRRAESLYLLPDGTSIPRRSLSKVAKMERGSKGVIERLQRHGAPELAGEPGAWLAAALRDVTRAVRHPGNHKYVWALSRRVRRHLPPSLPYPKVTTGQTQMPFAA